MAEYSRFFDHVDGDRTYNADDFAEYFRQILTSGILNGGENLQVYVNGTDRIARIKPGKAWLEGYFYKLTDELQLPLEEAHGTYDRIDRIVLRLNTGTEARSIKAFVKTGEPASNSVAPAITREGDIYELSLAQILVIHNTTAVPEENVTDERLDSDICGLVNSLIQVDTTAMQEEFDAFMESIAGQSYVSQEEFDTVTDQLFQSGLDGKNLLETSIESKGGMVSKQGEVATFNELDDGIQSIITDPSGDATAEASDILDGKIAYSKYRRLVGTMSNRGSKTFIPSDSTQTGSAGYYSGITVNPRPSLTGTATTGNVLSGKTFYGSNYTRQTGTMSNRGSISNTITTQGGSYTIPNGYHSGSGKVTANFANLVAGNIKDGVSVGGVTGTYSGEIYKPTKKTTITSGTLAPEQSRTVPIPADDRHKLFEVYCTGNDGRNRSQTTLIFLGGVTIPGSSQNNAYLPEVTAGTASITITADDYKSFEDDVEYFVGRYD